MSNNNGTGIEGVIRVCINETDLISKSFSSCHECALSTAIQRSTGKFPDTLQWGATLYDSDDDRLNKKDGIRYHFEPQFWEDNYKELKKKALNREKVFHYIDLIPVKK